MVNNRTPDLIKKSGLLALSGARGFARGLLTNYAKAGADARRNLCQSFDIPYLLVKDPNCEETLAQLSALQPDLIVNARTRSIFKPELLKLAPLGAINIHHGILPDFRGTFCDLQALGQGLSPGFSIHKMTEKIDQGEILYTEEASSNHNSYLAYIQESSQREAMALRRLIEDVARTGTLPPGRQNLKTDETRFYRTPSLKQIQDFKKKGIHL